MHLSVGDALLVFNHELGKYDVSYIAYIENDGFNYYNTLTLNFENNISVKVMSEHGFFDSTLNFLVSDLLYLTDNVIVLPYL